MEYRSVGKSGLKVSEIALGSCMNELARSHNSRIGDIVCISDFDSLAKFF